MKQQAAREARSNALDGKHDELEHPSQDELEDAGMVGLGHDWHHSTTCAARMSRKCVAGAQQIVARTLTLALGERTGEVAREFLNAAWALAGDVLVFSISVGHTVRRRAGGAPYGLGIGCGTGSNARSNVSDSLCSSTIGAVA